MQILNLVLVGKLIRKIEYQHPFLFNKTNTKVLNIYNNYINTGFRSFLKGTGSLNMLNASLATLNHTYGNWGDKFFANTYIIYSKNHEYISTNSIVSQNYSQSENIIIKDKNFYYFHQILINISNPYWLI